MSTHLASTIFNIGVAWPSSVLCILDLDADRDDFLIFDQAALACSGLAAAQCPGNPSFLTPVSQVFQLDLRAPPPLECQRGQPYRHLRLTEVRMLHVRATAVQEQMMDTIN
mmetsp:Transcript_48894/g.87177  ORF Transcript_48894/g.87177 Transcript_48894/m.87177 type:complete len:111 (+) Transcript_48894:807-1139(+)